jgi:hypothetical protein
MMMHCCSLYDHFIVIDNLPYASQLFAPLPVRMEADVLLQMHHVTVLEQVTKATGVNKVGYHHHHHQLPF